MYDDYDDYSDLIEEYGLQDVLSSNSTHPQAHYQDVYDYDDQSYSSPSPIAPKRFVKTHKKQQDDRTLHGVTSNIARSHGQKYTSSKHPEYEAIHPEHNYPMCIYEQAASSSTNACNHNQQFAHAPDATRYDPEGNISVVQGVRLRRTTDLPDMYRGLFKFDTFNAVQSRCFHAIMNTDENMVISAPTGSGKTALFELAIIRMLLHSASAGRQAKCIYVAPTKALCSEKFRDWQTKFQPLGINCCELTGDTVHFGKSAWGDAHNASIIVTTGEKWDSLTRSWDNHDQVLRQIQLFVVDEVHILNESRGSTLEVVISRMKLRGSQVRFVMVSATVPNIQDVAAWIGNGPYGGPAKVMAFGDEFRPCKLTRFVYGYPRKKEQNDFVFNRTLDYKLYEVLQKHTSHKPVLVFCATRKGVIDTAKQIMKDFEDSKKSNTARPWMAPTQMSYTFHDKLLNDLAACGIGVHHAGINLDDRRTTEDLYMKKILRIVFATSTLAVGVNLPAHTVIIKGVKMFMNNACHEYSDLDIMQMMGRAGRPQFDKEGVAIIMCESELQAKYQALAQGLTLLESCLHQNLSEHLNSEIGLGTITNTTSAKQWLRGSFLFQRIQQNPRHYGIAKDSGQTWEDRIDEMVAGSIKALKDNELVQVGEDGDELSSTEYGDIMSKYYIRQSTMSSILKMPEQVTLREMLEMLSSSSEFSDIKIRSGEKIIYNNLRNRDEIRFKIKRLERPADKISLIIQAVLGGISLNDSEFRNNDSSPSLEALSVFRHVSRITRAMVEAAITRKYGAQIKYGLELMRCLTAKAWEDRPIVLRQIEHIGDKSYVEYSYDVLKETLHALPDRIKVLAQHSITSFSQLRKQEPSYIETILGRRPPFGHEVLAWVNSLPNYSLAVSEVNVQSSNGKKPVEIELLVECGLLQPLGSSKVQRSKGSKLRDITLVLTVTSDLEFIDFRRIPTKALNQAKSFKVTATLANPSQSVIVQICSENVAGLTKTKTYKPSLNPSQFPIPNTRPQTSLEMDLEGLEEMPDFWDMTIDGDDDDIAIISTGLRGSSPINSLPSQEGILQMSNTNSSSTMEDMPQIPKQLPNGRFACNHLCKDKTACRHFCCREGLDKPPPWTKARVGKVYPTENQQKAKLQASKPKSKPKPKGTGKERQDARLEDLDKWHTQANVNASIQLPEGHRIKMDSRNLKRKPLSSESFVMANIVQQRKQKPCRHPVKFDLEFSDIKDQDDFEISDTELPDTKDLLDSCRTDSEFASGSSSGLGLCSGTVSGSYNGRLATHHETMPSSDTLFPNLDANIDMLIENLPTSDLERLGAVQSPTAAISTSNPMATTTTNTEKQGKPKPGKPFGYTDLHKVNSNGGNKNKNINLSLYPLPSTPTLSLLHNKRKFGCVDDEKAEALGVRTVHGDQSASMTKRPRMESEGTTIVPDSPMENLIANAKECHTYGDDDKCRDKNKLSFGIPLFSADYHHDKNPEGGADDEEVDQLDESSYYDSPSLRPQADEVEGVRLGRSVFKASSSSIPPKKLPDTVQDRENERLFPTVPEDEGMRDDYDRALADLEEWLQSDAVVIVPSQLNN